MKPETSTTGLVESDSRKTAFAWVMAIAVLGMVGYNVISFAAERLDEWWSQLPSLESYMRSTPADVTDARPRPAANNLAVAELDSVAIDAVVLIKSEDGQGSAVVVAPDLLLSACHIGKQNVRAFPANGEPIRLHLETVSSGDRCLFKADRALPHAVPGVRTVATLKPREKVYAYGYPSGNPTLSAGVFIDFYIDEDGTRFVRSTARVAPGNSGGALFDSSSNLIGVIQAFDRDKLSHSLIADKWWEQ